MSLPCRTLEGHLEERLLDLGTRSERRGVVLVDDAGTATPVHVKGDNPYEPETLRALVGQRVRMKGTMRRNTLRAEPADVVVVQVAAGPVMEVKSTDRVDHGVPEASEDGDGQ